MGYKGSEIIRCSWLVTNNEHNSCESFPSGYCKFHGINLAETKECYGQGQLSCYSPPLYENGADNQGEYL